MNGHANGHVNGYANGHANGHLNGFANGATETIDVAIVGAGISGINAAYRVKTRMPDYTYSIFEARADMGGTWDLFKYPGLRSDSDFYTFGFEWNTWPKDNPIAPGGDIKDYLKLSAKKEGIDSHIKFNHRLNAMEWSTEDRFWNLTLEVQGHTKHVRARYIIIGTGYYDYKEPLRAVIPGLENFKGKVVHPQFWPEDLDYANKKVAIIGSGATAITLVPNMAPTAARVTMVQRSPSYVYPMPNSIRKMFGWLIPSIFLSRFSRLFFIFAQRIMYEFFVAFPKISRNFILKQTKKLLGDSVAIDPHFTPKYNPWDQRVCFSPNGDFFESLRSGKADVKTGTIKTVTENSIVLDNGDVIEADIIITATGLKLAIADNIPIKVDGEKVLIPEKYFWNGSMLQDVPNLCVIIGYTNASWTLGADATVLLFIRLLKLMKRRDAVAVVPRVEDASVLTPMKLTELNSTYLTVAEKQMPKTAQQSPWRPRRSYYVDSWQAMFGRVDKCIEFIGAAKK